MKTQAKNNKFKTFRDLYDIRRPDSSVNAVRYSEHQKALARHDTWSLLAGVMGVVGVTSAMLLPIFKAQGYLPSFVSHPIITAAALAVLGVLGFVMQILIGKQISKTGDRVDWAECYLYPELLGTFSCLDPILLEDLQEAETPKSLMERIEYGIRELVADIRSFQKPDSVEDLYSNKVAHQQQQLKLLIDIVVKLGLMDTDKVVVLADGGDDDLVYRERANWLYRKLYDVSSIS